MSDPSTDRTRCPVCGLPNRCAMEVQRATGATQPPCWCVAREFTPDLLARVPEESRGSVCLCPACAGSS
jgi:hypothetical protein